MDHSKNMLPGYASMVAGVAEDSLKFDANTDPDVVDRLFYDLNKRTADMLVAADNFRESIGLARIYESVVTALGR